LKFIAILTQPEIAIWPAKTGNANISELLKLTDSIEITTASLGFDHGGL